MEGACFKGHEKTTNMQDAHLGSLKRLSTGCFLMESSLAGFTFFSPHDRLAVWLHNNPKPHQALGAGLQYNQTRKVKCENPECDLSVAKALLQGSGIGVAVISESWESLPLDAHCSGSADQGVLMDMDLEPIVSRPTPKSSSKSALCSRNKPLLEASGVDAL